MVGRTVSWLYSALVLLALGIVLLFPFEANGQTWQLDSLRAELRERHDRDSSFILLLCDYAYAFDNKSYDSVLLYAQQAYQLSRKSGFEPGIAYSLWLTGMAYYYLDQIDSSQVNLDRALPFAISAHRYREQARIYNTMANVARYQGNLTAALGRYFESLRIREKISDFFGMAITLNNIANVYSERGDWQRALPYFQRSLALRRKVNRESSAIMLLSTLGENHLRLGHIDSSKYYIGRALRFASANNDSWGYVHVYYALINFYINRHQPDSALHYVRLGLSASQDVNSKDREAWFLNKWGELLNSQGEYRQAILLADSAKRIGMRLKRLDYVVASEKARSEALAGMGKYQDAYESAQLYKLLSDSIQSKAFGDALRNRELEYQLENEKTKAESNRLVFEERQKESQALIWMIASIAIGVSGLAFLFYRNIQLRIRTNNELHDKQEIIQKQNHEIQAQNEELQLQQEEIATTNERLEQQVQVRTRELHESIQQLTEQNQGLEQFSYIVLHNLRAPLARISGIINLMKMAGTKPGELIELVDLLEKTSVDFEEVIRDLSHIVSLRKHVNFSRERIELRPFLDSVLRLMEIDLLKVQGQTKVNLNGVTEVFSVRPYLHSIFFNLLSNAIKYRDVHRELTIVVEANRFATHEEFVVRDNGIGIDLAGSNASKIFGLYQRFHLQIDGKGFGLYLVKTQVELLGGTISVASEPGKGSTFTIVFPR